MLKKLLLSSMVWCCCTAIFCNEIYSQNKTKKDQESEVVEPEEAEKLNVLTVAIGFTNKFRVKYERVVGEKISLTITGSGYYSLFPGVLAAGGVRFYLTDVAPEGFYVSPRLHCGYFNLSTWSYNDRTYNLSKNNFVTLGGGGQIGYQFLVGRRKNIVIDLAAGAKYLQLPSGINLVSLNNNGQNVQYYTDDIDAMRFIWSTTGPGSYLDATIAFGFAF